LVTEESPSKSPVSTINLDVRPFNVLLKTKLKQLETPVEFQVDPGGSSLRVFL
jgi:hypothetical protein